MRLSPPEREHPPRFAKLHERIREAIGGEQVPDVLRTLHHRPELFGRPFSAWVESLLRGPSEWSEGERELIAAFVSSVNAYEFCTRAHSRVASLLLDGEVVELALADRGNAPISAQLRATLDFLEELTLSPEVVDRENVAPVLDAGVSVAALEDAVEIAAAFCVINRIGNALGWALQSERSLQVSAGALVERGYAQAPDELALGAKNEQIGAQR